MVLKDLAAQAEVNIAIDDALQRRITVRLKDVPFLDALRIVASSVGFEVKEEAGVFIVAPTREGASQMAPVEASSSFVFEIGSLDPKLACEIVKTLGSHLAATAFPDLGIVVVTGPYSEVNSARAALGPWLSKVAQGADEQTIQVVRVDHLDPQEALSSFFVQFRGVRIVAIRNTSFVLISGKQADVASKTAMGARSGSGTRLQAQDTAPYPRSRTAWDGW